MSDEIDNEVIDIESKLKNIQSMDDVDLEEWAKLGRGKTPEGIRQKCLDLCKDYLAGNWSQQTLDSIQVERITGGFMNQIYHCSIREPNERERVPQEVSIKAYGEIPIDDSVSISENRMRDMIISLVFSEKGVGPKLYGIYEGGLIQKFYKHRQFLKEDQKNPKLVKKVFQTLARIHSWELPLKMNPNKFMDIIGDGLNQAFINFPINDWIEEYNCEALKKYEVRAEKEWLWNAIKEIGSPAVFTHNDYRSSNLMIAEPNDELVVCDFDISYYGYRGYDFVSLMKEWGRHHFDVRTIEGLQINDEFRPYIEIYVEECIRIHGKSYAENPINSVDHILKEAKAFLLVYFMFMTSMVLKQSMKDPKDPTPNPKIMMDFADLNHKNYHLIKDILIEQKIFD